MTEQNTLKKAARLAAVQALYQIEMSPARPASIIADFLEKRTPSDMPVPDAFDPELFASIVKGVLERGVDIDAMLEGSLDEKWPLARLEKILKGVLRAGAAELLLHGQIDAGIIINDYVDVAHGFFAGKEPALANAVLDRIGKSLRG